MKNLSLFLIAVAVFAAASPASMAADAVTPGELRVDPPTLICLGFQWRIEGDENRNASVHLFYRKTGAERWNQALPLLRIGGERVFRPDIFPRDFVAQEMFAGSIMDLDPGTEYEVRLIILDPDGVNGPAERIVTVSTRPEPRPYEGGRVFHVYPVGYGGEKKELAFTGLKTAYYGPGGGDWAVAAPARVRPGDTILVHAGLYKSDRFSYSDPLGLPFDGTYVLTAKGTPDKPITIRAAGDGEVIFDGAGAYRLFDVTAADYHHFEGLTIRNTDIAFHAGLKDVIGSSGLTVKNCRFEDIGIGVITQYAGSRNFYIADNVMLGRNDPHRILAWYNPGPYGANSLRSYFGVKVYGQGHVICNNYVAYFHDGITICTHGLPSDDPDLQAVSIDICNNDIFNVCDDFIEADGGVRNIRVLRNRGFNSAQCGLSAQPVFGGPVYFIRNVLYNIPWGVAFKFKVHTAGQIVYHNTIISEWLDEAPFSNTHFRNNLFLGTDNPDGRPILDVRTYTSYTTFDYNGYRPNRADTPQFVWARPHAVELRNFVRDELLREWFLTFDEFRNATGLEQNGILVDYDIFENVEMPDSTKPETVYAVEGIDFRLREGSAAVDAGCILPNVTDGFTGSAPDLGAYERGAPPVRYGPRTQSAPGRR